jgi:hypothetical protein
MILIKEITSENMRQFAGLPANILVAEHKKGPLLMKHIHYMIGIVVSGDDGNGGRLFYVQFSNDESSPSFNTVFELIEDQRALYSFYYIEIKKQK